MFDFAWNLGAFIVALGVLVTFHEFGHFWVARRLGVKVLRFSVGFGRPLWMWRDRQGTEYTISMIPLGGYVKMLDEREGEVPESEAGSAFNRQALWRRTAIVAAGPAANFLLAIVFYAVSFMIGVPALKPVVGAITPDSIAARAGLEDGQEILAIDGKPVRSWQEVNLALVSRIGDVGRIDFEIRRPGGPSATRSLRINNWQVPEKAPNLMAELGFAPRQPEIAARIAEVAGGSPAAKGELQTGDTIVGIDGEKITEWRELVAVVGERPGQTVEIKVIRDGETFARSITLTANEVDGRQVGYLGVGPDISEFYHTLQFGLLGSLGQGMEKTWEMTALSGKMLVKLLTGNVSVKNLGGPISIAQGAGVSASSGLVAFLFFLAMISVNLGFINLLPIPVLDGGHLLFFGVEAVKGGPLSERAQELGMRIGMVMVLALMLVAVYNDLMRI